MMNPDAASSLNTKNVHEAVQNLTENDKFSAQKFWKM